MFIEQLKIQNDGIWMTSFSPFYNSTQVSSVGILEVILSVYILLSTQKMIYLNKATKLLLRVKYRSYLPKLATYRGSFLTSKRLAELHEELLR